MSIESHSLAWSLGCGALFLCATALADPTGASQADEKVMPTYENCISAGANEAFCSQFPRATPERSSLEAGLGEGQLTINGLTLVVGRRIPTHVDPPLELRPGRISTCGTDACEGECGQVGCEDQPIVDVLSEGTKLAVLAVVQGFSRGSYSTTIRGISVLSPNYQTSNGLGVGSSLGDVFARCEGAEGWYSYISGDFELRCPAFERMQFIFDRAGFVGDEGILGMADGDRLPKTGLDMNARITKVETY